MHLPSLSILMASCNQITSIPEDIGRCTRLQAIVLQSNRIKVTRAGCNAVRWWCP